MLSVRLLPRRALRPPWPNPPIPLRRAISRRAQGSSPPRSANSDAPQIPAATTEQQSKSLISRFKTFVTGDGSPEDVEAETLRDRKRGKRAVVAERPPSYNSQQPQRAKNHPADDNTSQIFKHGPEASSLCAQGTAPEPQESETMHPVVLSGRKRAISAMTIEYRNLTGQDWEYKCRGGRGIRELRSSLQSLRGQEQKETKAVEPSKAAADSDAHAWGGAGADTARRSWYSQKNDVGTSQSRRQLDPSDSSAMDTALNSFDGGESEAVSDIRKVESSRKSRNLKITPNIQGLRIRKHEVETIKRGKNSRKLELGRTPTPAHPESRLSAEHPPTPPPSLAESAVPTPLGTPLASSIDSIIADMSKQIADQIRERLLRDFQNMGQNIPTTSQEAIPKTQEANPNSQAVRTPPQALQPPLEATPKRGEHGISSQVNAGNAAQAPIRKMSLNSTRDGQWLSVDQGKASAAAKRNPEDDEKRHPSISNPLDDTCEFQVLQPDNATDETARPTASERAPPAIVDELFPEKVKMESTMPPEREVPRLKVAVGEPKRQGEPKLSESQHVAKRFQELGEDPTILLFRNASKSLVEEDFKRLIPRGKHISDWQNSGSFIKVIPGRNRITMERENFYFIIFPSPASARLYQLNAAKHHKIAQENTQTSFFSPIPPPPGYSNSQGVELDPLKQAYALLPTSQRMQLHIMQRPHGLLLQQLMVKGGYPKIVDIPHKHKVLIHIEGSGQQLSEMRSFVQLEGQKRNLSYEIVEAEDAIVKVAEWRLKRIRYHKDDDAEGEIDEGKDDDADEDAALLPDGEVKVPQNMKWIISFTSDAEARRFARAVHGRRFPIYPKGSMVYERPGKMRAEVLW